jgi:hypothetical protein
VIFSISHKADAITYKTTLNGRKIDMKKMFVAMVAFAFIFTVAGSAMAGGSKPPKNLCFGTDPNVGGFFLGIKKGNKIVAFSTKIDMYTVQGVYGGGIPISGTGFMDGDRFIFQINTCGGESSISVIGTLDFVSEAGAIQLNKTTEPGVFASTEHDLILVPCGDL